MGQVQVSITPHGSVQQSRHLPRKYVWTLCWSRHSACLHQWPFACYKRLLDRTSYCPQRDVHPPPEGWAQGQRQIIMLWRPKIWLFGLSRHSWRVYAHTKESLGHSIPCISKKLQTIASVYQYDKFLRWHVAKTLWDSRPITCLNFQKRQIRLERRAPKVFWWYQTCDRMWSIVCLPRLQRSIFNTYWCFQTTNWRSRIPKRASPSLSIHEIWTAPNRITPQPRNNPFSSGNSQIVP